MQNEKLILSKKTKKEKNLISLIEYFKKEKELSIADICKRLQCNRQNAYNYIHLIEKNYDLSSRKNGKLKLYSINFSSNETNPCEYLPLTLDTIRSYCIIQELQEQPCPKNDFSNHFSFKSAIPDDSRNELLPIDIGKTYYYKLLNNLIDNGEIILNEKNNNYYLTGKTIPLIWSLDYDAIYDIYNELSNIPKGSVYFNQLESIYKKLGIYISDFPEDSSADIPHIKNYLIYGRKRIAFKDISNQLNKLSDVDFKNKTIEITYTTRKDKIKTMTVAIGLIVYCIEKDSIYLMCENLSLNTKPSIINLSSVLSVKEGDIICNHPFNSKKYLNFYEEMFSISTEDLTEVKVEFDLSGNIERKIKILALQRNLTYKHAKISYNEDQTRIIFSDNIRGVADFKAYLRQFGSSAHVISPLKLKEEMYNSVEETLQRYLEVSNE